MNSTVKYSVFVASLILMLPYAAYADQGSTSQYASQRLQIQLTSLTCINTYATSYLNDVASAINNSTITSNVTNTDLPKLGTDFSALQADVNANNTAQFKTDELKYKTDARTANHDAVSAIRAAHNKTINSTLKSDVRTLQSNEKSCLYATKQQQAQHKIQMFNTSLSHAQNMTNKLGSHGANTTGLTQIISLANTKIQAFQTAVNNAQNSTQLQAALSSFCLYNGCKSPNNFHFAANTAIQADQAKLNVLATKNSTSSYQGLVSQAQTDLNNAQTALNQVGANQYQGTQSSIVWNDIKATADVIHQLQIVNHKHH